VLEGFNNALAGAVLPPYHVVFGPLTVDAVVDVRRSIKDLVDWACREGMRLDVEIAEFSPYAGLDWSALGF